MPYIISLCINIFIWIYTYVYVHLFHYRIKQYIRYSFHNFSPTNSLCFWILNSLLDFEKTLYMKSFLKLNSEIDVHLWHILLGIALYVTNSISVIRHSKIADLSVQYCMSWTYVQYTFIMLNDFRCSIYKVKSEWAYGHWLCIFVCLLVLFL
jgi:hypothetical protein